METKLAGKVVLVTGASGGIGGEIVRAFAREGCRVVAHAGRHPERVEALATEIGPLCLPLVADLTVEGDVVRLFRAIEQGWGPVDVLVANAGQWPTEATPLHQLSLARWNETLAVNLTSVFLSVREMVRGVVTHQQTEPAIVLIGSTAALFGEANHGDYATAKAGVTYGFLRTLKNELARVAPKGRANVVCPGWTMTPTKRQLTRDPDKVRRVLQTIPMRKIANPIDVANAVVYLASGHLAGHLNGAMIPVSGGMEGRVLYEPQEVDPDVI